MQISAIIELFIARKITLLDWVSYSNGNFSNQKTTFQLRQKSKVQFSIQNISHLEKPRVISVKWHIIWVLSNIYRLDYIRFIIGVKLLQYISINQVSGIASATHCSYFHLMLSLLLIATITDIQDSVPQLLYDCTYPSKELCACFSRAR